MCAKNKSDAPGRAEVALAGFVTSSTVSCPVICHDVILHMSWCHIAYVMMSYVICQARQMLRKLIHVCLFMLPFIPWQAISFLPSPMPSCPSFSSFLRYQASSLGPHTCQASALPLSNLIFMIGLSFIKIPCKLGPQLQNKFKASLSQGWREREPDTCKVHSKRILITT